jgi:tRNA nucleotidyltransferase (CCA-adding enzyme)
LRHVGPAFSEDPLRVLRVARFAARFGFRVAPETEALMRAIASSGELETLSAERVWQELAKALMEAKPSRFFVILRRCGALGQLLPELEALFAAPARRSGRSASLRAIDAAAAAGEALAVRYAVLAGNLAPALRTRERLAASFSRRVNAPTECRELAGLGARLRDRVDRATTLAPAALIDLLLAVDALRRPERLAGLLRVCALWRRTMRVSRAANDPQAIRLSGALRVIRGVKATSLAAGDRGGSDIARRIRSARLKALREWLKALDR